jgi:sterol desaturase/sphingolipid hydroxylase (fatty acid hydroxylase superfamily)
MHGIAGLSVVQVMMVLLGLLGLVFTTLEGLAISRRRGRAAYDWRAYWTTMRINLWRLAVEAIPLGAVLGVALPFGAWMYAHRAMTVPMDTWWGWVAMFFCTEFFYYWLHRAGHRVRWYWASHQVHHTGNEYNLSAAFRQSITGKLSGGFVFFAPQCLLGFPPDAVLVSYGINLFYQYWIHTGLVGKLGWMEGVFNTPSAHRVHHAANVEYLDCNYGGTIMLFDRIFGTYVPERDGVPIRYGLVRRVTSYSAIRICLSEWAHLFGDVGRALLKGRAADALAHAFGPPGWAPDGQGLTTEALRHQAHGTASPPVGAPSGELTEEPGLQRRAA